MKKQEPVFNYTSKCCGVQAEKTPCVRDPEDKAEGKFSEATLGTWHCPKCRRACAVIRTKNENLFTA